MDRMVVVVVDTSDLTGVALDWAVANYVTGLLLAIPCPPVEALAGYSPSTNWKHGGPLLTKHITHLSQSRATAWWAHCDDHIGEGHTALTAVCRAVVAAKLGDTVSVPAELLENA